MNKTEHDYSINDKLYINIKECRTTREGYYDNVELYSTNSNANIFKDYIKNVKVNDQKKSSELSNRTTMASSFNPLSVTKLSNNDGFISPNSSK